MTHSYPPRRDCTPGHVRVSRAHSPGYKADDAPARGATEGVTMLVLGIVLMLIGFLLAIPVLWTIGIVLALIGAVLWVADGTGAAWGRRWY